MENKYRPIQYSVLTELPSQVLSYASVCLLFLCRFCIKFLIHTPPALEHMNLSWRITTNTTPAGGPRQYPKKELKFLDAATPVDNRKIALCSWCRGKGLSPLPGLENSPLPELENPPVSELKTPSIPEFSPNLGIYNSTNLHPGNTHSTKLCLRETLYKACLPLRCLLFFTWAERQLLSAILPNKSLVWGFDTVWLFGSPWLLATRIPIPSELQHLRWWNLSPQSCYTYNQGHPQDSEETEGRLRNIPLTISMMEHFI